MMEVPRDEQGDMLYIDTDVAVDGSQLKVYWTNNKASDYTDYNRFSFDAGSDQYLVPLSSAPDWLLVDSDKTLHICFPAEMMGEFSFQQITLYDRLMTD